MKWRFFSGILFLCAAVALLGCAGDRAARRISRPSRTIRSELGVEWARPEGIPLYMDIYGLDPGAPPRPVVLIFHGGGWLLNDRRIMAETAAYLASHGNYIVCNADYRRLGDSGNRTTMPQIVGDALGALAWVKANIADRGGDPRRIAVSGDSAGGHLAAMVALSGGRLGREPYGPPDFVFTPTWWPEGRDYDGADLSVQAVVCHYPVTDLYELCARGGFEGGGNGFWAMAGRAPRGIFGPGVDAREAPAFYKACSPIDLIRGQDLLAPFYCAAGSADRLVAPSGVAGFVQALRDSGHRAEYWEYPGKGHAYLDAGTNIFLGTDFKRDAPVALDRMLDFLDGVFASS
jgi:acetyl esterase/lipase